MKMDKLKEKMKGKKMSENEMSAKKSVLESLRDEMAGMMGDKLSGLKKVTVAADSKQGLEKGLAKAKEMVDEHGGTVGESTAHELEKAVEGDEMDTHPTDNAEESAEHEKAESPEFEAGEEEEKGEEDMSEEEINAKLEKLMALKKKKEKKE